MYCSSSPLVIIGSLITYSCINYSGKDVRLAHRLVWLEASLWCSGSAPPTGNWLGLGSIPGQVDAFSVSLLLH